MAFLDNSGDIILDAVLTDTGRKRLARGDGSFRVTKFCLHDDEIDYGLYNKSHTSGSAYYDLEILQTPILEAFTNNTSGMKYKLLSISRTNLLYLPIMKLFNSAGSNANCFGLMNSSKAEDTSVATNMYYIAVDEDSVNDLRGTDTKMPGGYLNGFEPSGAENNIIEAHQGIDNTAKSETVKIDPSLEETQYIIEMDNRLGTLCDSNGTVIAPTFIDDDNIASYFVTTINQDIVKSLSEGNSSSQGTLNPNYTSLLGARGSAIGFRIRSTIEVRDSTYLFTLLGNEKAVVSGATGHTSKDYRYIDSIIRVSGATLGYSIDIPVRYVKLKP
tara:strand:- start:1330 stop:2319 length:990 start_codon:yes stop_codon:yes gene_type:complete